MESYQLLFLLLKQCENINFRLGFAVRNFPAASCEPGNSRNENHYFEGIKMNQMQLIQRKEELIGKTNLDFLDQVYKYIFLKHCF